MDKKKLDFLIKSMYQRKKHYRTRGYNGRRINCYHLFFGKQKVSEFFDLYYKK